ncbi:MAG: hypothetical protein JSV09_10385 [Thermoplasmata archaeon]|nr:MAG: hypothetical protein JSV09_10385 [Thermoplasmata archaeon]
MKKLISVFLVFSLLTINCAYLNTVEEKRESRKKKHGANLIIQKINGQQPGGELIVVKQNSLLLLNTEGKDVSVGIDEIKVITVVKKSKVLKGVGTGLLVGAGSGVAIGLIIGMFSLPEDSPSDFLRNAALIGTSVGVFLGATIGAAAGTDEIFQIEGMTDAEIQETLNKLRKKARIRDY